MVDRLAVILCCRSRHGAPVGAMNAPRAHPGDIHLACQRHRNAAASRSSLEGVGEPEPLREVLKKGSKAFLVSPGRRLQRFRPQSGVVCGQCALSEPQRAEHQERENAALPSIAIRSPAATESAGIGGANPVRQKQHSSPDIATRCLSLADPIGWNSFKGDRVG